MRPNKHLTDSIKSITNKIGANNQSKIEKLKQVEDICNASRDQPIKYSLEIKLCDKAPFIVKKTVDSITEQHSFPDIDNLLNFIK